MLDAVGAGDLALGAEEELCEFVILHKRAIEPLSIPEEHTSTTPE
jgi:hypothetical protein